MDTFGEELKKIIAEGKELDVQLKALKERTSEILDSVWEDKEQLDKIAYMLPNCLGYYRFRIWSYVHELDKENDEK